MNRPVHATDDGSSVRLPCFVAAAMALSFAAAILPSTGNAQRPERSGKEVVEATCLACHGSGAQGAPKIGDEKSWARLAARGLTSLSASALRGIRKMPSHGGNPGLSDIEIERAITYMVNESGGRWVEPISGATPAVERRGEQIVKVQCLKCHLSGLGGAPRMGDRDAWTPRLKRGLDFLVRSAINGHGPMPPRGGMADLTDSEIRAAIGYMYIQSSPQVRRAAASRAVTYNPNRRVVGGIVIYLGVVPAEIMRTQYANGGPHRAASPAIPEGKHYYQIDVRLFDTRTRAALSAAEVEVTVAEPVMGREKKKLEPVVFNNMTGYASYFRLPNRNYYTITVAARRPGSPKEIQARFDFKRD
jgi:cytochrome c5